MTEIPADDQTRYSELGTDSEALESPQGVSARMRARGRVSLAEFRAWFESMVDRSGGPSACHPWRGDKLPRGYGYLEIPAVLGGRFTTSAHRVAWLLGTGKWPENQVLHSCDNPPCCNLAHLMDGTQRENMRQMVARGRANYVRHERHGSAKLTEQAVLEIRQLRLNGWSLQAIADQYSVHRATIGRAIQGVTWR